MIDWVSFLVDCEPHEPIHGGRVAAFNADGEVEWTVNKRLEVEGTGSSRVQIRSVTVDSYELSGNLTKFFQGHNVWGTSDLPALIEAWDRYAFTRGLPMMYGEPLLRRVDVNLSYRFDSQAEALEWLRWAAQVAHWSHRGRGFLHREGTVYWGQGSRRSSLKAYSKHLELVSTKRAKEGSPIYEITKGIVRVEATLRGMELKRMGLEHPTKWTQETAKLVMMSLLERLTLPDNAPSESLLDVLPQHLKAVYAEWLHGRDPRKVYPRRTAYRYRKALLDYGVDIFIPPAQPSQVGKHPPAPRRSWDIRKLEPWTPSPEEVAALGYFDPRAYRPGHSA